MGTAKIGILMLDTTFLRPPGDIGNERTFPFPVQYATVEGASVERVVKEQDTSLIQPFVQAARRLEHQGVKAITTSCGFLARFQQEIERHIHVPFYSSSLIQIPFVYRLIGQQGQIGVLTARKSSLGPEHFKGVGVDHTPLAIEGMDQMHEFTRCIIDGENDMHIGQIEKEIVEKALELVNNYPNIKAIVLECTNMPPYRESIKRATHLPVFDIVTLTEYVYAALP